MSGQTISQSRAIAIQLAEFVEQSPSPSDRARAALHVLDWTGCALAGAASETGLKFASAFADEGAGPCTLISGGAALPRAAAFANGALGNVLEMDDVDKRAILHPGPTVIPAALAVAEHTGAGAEAFLDAVVRGYEAVIRLGRAVGPAHYAFWHNTGTCGPVGAAVAAASLLGLDRSGAASAVGLAATAAGGLWRTRHEPQSMAKQLHTAKAAEAGVSAAYLAKAGAVGPLEIFEGAQGFFDAMCGDADPEVIIADYGAGWRIHDVSFKPWPACRHAHATIDAALLAKSELASGSEDIERIEIETYPDAIAFCDKAQPRSVIEAKFSLQHAAAAVLVDGPPGLAAFEPDYVNRSDVAALRSITSVAATPRFKDVYPDRYGAAVRVHVKSGDVVEACAPDAWGDPENPVDETVLSDKAKMLIVDAGGVDPAAADRVVDAALALGEGGTLDAYVVALRGLGL